ncbi:GNAT family N-acetyltransferase [Planctomycetota bacterium]
MSIEFKSPLTFERGFLYGLLEQGYADLLESDLVCAEELKAQWRQFDHDTFAYPETIGACVLVSLLDQQAIGLVSWNPRGLPAQGLIGQNCILPPYRQRSFGRQQIHKAIEILTYRQAQRIIVSTSSHPFFVAAHRMYEACGFRKTGRSQKENLPGIEVIEYALTIK